MEIGVFIPIGNNGWLISSTSPQYTPSFDLNREVVLRAERYGFDFALSMIKLRGFGGKSRYWDDNLESFTLMAGLASITTRIELYATVAVLTMPPPLTARMAAPAIPAWSSPPSTAPTTSAAAQARSTIHAIQPMR